MAQFIGGREQDVHRGEVPVEKPPGAQCRPRFGRLREGGQLPKTLLPAVSRSTSSLRGLRRSITVDHVAWWTSANDLSARESLRRASASSTARSTLTAHPWSQARAPLYLVEVPHEPGRKLGDGRGAVLWLPQNATRCCDALRISATSATPPSNIRPGPGTGCSPPRSGARKTWVIN